MRIQFDDQEKSKVWKDEVMTESTICNAKSSQLKMRSFRKWPPKEWLNIGRYLRSSPQPTLQLKQSQL